MVSMAARIASEHTMPACRMSCTSASDFTERTQLTSSKLSTSFHSGMALCSAR
ncbi:Uncharacterised protein [Mycobacteroides abscessus subsp. abscessus]|nr:Uncharacterised protein [Mycobacteroides abscessus subsp. abscessus]